MLRKRTINPKFVISSGMQCKFVDKDTSQPLCNGVVYFWSDKYRSAPKQVYRIFVDPLDQYIYIPLDNPIVLSPGGVFWDGFSDLIPYYYPWDDKGEPEKYFIEVYSEGGKESGVFQWSRGNWPLDNFVNTSESTAAKAAKKMR